jgi:hypothetical protein
MPPRRSKRSKPSKNNYEEEDDYEEDLPQQEEPVNKSLSDLITDVGCSIEALRPCSSLQDEFTAIKKAYFKRILVDHPGILLFLIL